MSMISAGYCLVFGFVAIVFNDSPGIVAAQELKPLASGLVIFATAQKNSLLIDRGIVALWNQPE